MPSSLQRSGHDYQALLDAEGAQQRHPKWYHFFNSSTSLRAILRLAFRRMKELKLKDSGTQSREAEHAAKTFALYPRDSNL